MADFAIFYIVDILTQRMLEVESGPAAVELLFGSKGTCQTSKNDGNSPEHVKIQELCSVETIRPISVRKRSYGGENPRARVR